MPKRTERKRDGRRFVQVAQRPSVGVELSTGRAWVGVDQQVGHGSADALFALTDAQYPAAFRNELGSFLGECWRGDHPDLLLFHPSSRREWRPEQWDPVRMRVIPPRFDGELWRHVDALGTATDSDAAEVSRALAGGAAPTDVRAGVLRGLEFRLAGEGAYPRPSGLIVGLTAGSDRDRARAVLGAPIDGAEDVFAVEGDLVRLGYADGGLVEIALSRPEPLPLPDGSIRDVLAVLGTPEHGEAYDRVALLAGGKSTRWAGPTFFPRRLVVFDGGVDLQVEHGRVLSARLRFRSGPDGAPYRNGDDLISALGWPPSVDDLRTALGAPVSTDGGFALYRYATGDLVVEFAGLTVSSMITILPGTSALYGMNRWRSGEYSLFLDALGLEASHPLVAHVRSLPGVRLHMVRGAVAAVEIGNSGHQAERFAAFIDGMPAEPVRSDLRFSSPYVGARDDVWELSPGWVTVRTRDGQRITSITVSGEPPRDSDAGV